MLLVILPNAVLVYSLASGGITLAIDGQLQGKVRQFGEVGKSGLTIDKPRLYIRRSHNPIDRSYTFTIRAEDQFGFSATWQGNLHYQLQIQMIYCIVILVWFLY